MAPVVPWAAAPDCASADSNLVDDGREVVLAQHGPGEYLGEVTLDHEKRSTSVQAIEPTTCCMVRRLTEQVKSPALQDVFGRVARVLTELSDPVWRRACAAPQADAARHCRSHRLVARDGEQNHERPGSGRLCVVARWPACAPRQAAACLVDAPRSGLRMGKLAMPKFHDCWSGNS